MIYPLDQIPSHMNKPEHSLQWHILQAQLRTNELLEQLINGNKQESQEETETIETTRRGRKSNNKEEL